MHLAFNDFKKQFDRKDHNKFWNILYIHSYPNHLTETIKCLHNNNTIQQHINGTILEEIPINQWVYCRMSNTYNDYKH
jgi:hypothetical protein